MLARVLGVTWGCAVRWSVSGPVTILLAAVLVTPATAAPRATDDSCPPAEVPEDGFADAAGATHESAIDCVVWWDVANGTSASTYSPAAHVGRAQMATFVANAIRRAGGTLPTAAADAFPDDDGVHEANIDALAAAGIVGGFSDGTYRPGGVVSRAQMASFLVTAFEHLANVDLPRGSDHFTDDDGTVHEAEIDAAAEAGFTGGVSPTAYDPDGPVTRAQMASFLARWLDLAVETAGAEPPAPAPSPSPSPAAGTLQILNVVNAAPGNEYVEVRNASRDPVILTGWYLRDAAGNRADWCQLTLQPQATARLHSRMGSNGPDECYAMRSTDMWDDAGDTARLYDASDRLIDTFIYP